MGRLPDYYKSLGIPKNASDADVKKAYRKLALKYHPDKNQGDKQAEEQFKVIAEAYATLGDAAKRRRYEESLRAPPAAKPGCPENFQWWGKQSGEAPGDPFAKQRHDSNRNAQTFAGFPSREFAGHFVPRKFSVNEATDLFASIFAGGDPFEDFSDFSDFGFGSNGNHAALTNGRGRQPNWDVKITKIKKADGTVVIERTDSSGRTTRTEEGNPVHTHTNSAFPAQHGSDMRYAQSTPSRPEYSQQFAMAPMKSSVGVPSLSRQDTAGCRANATTGISRGSWTTGKPLAGHGSSQRGVFVNWSSN